MKQVKLNEIKNNKARIQSVEDTIEILKKGLDMSQENFIIIGVDTKNNIIFSKTLFKGGLNWCAVEPKRIFKELLINNCSGFIIGHNHPSGDLNPSDEDLKISNKIKEISKILEFRFLDNVIFDDKQFISFFEEDLL